MICQYSQSLLINRITNAVSAESMLTFSLYIGTHDHNIVGSKTLKQL